ncbi:hypothetical protein [Bradyrhizobium sp. USDA 241]|uniref:hypothetical protein n=1 Tax=Bradyrhizobium sp. USDA 241 TaxID=3377725 RepID=UPI003C76572C
MTALTGITDEMVAGHRFDDAAITAFAENAVIVIAHNSGFVTFSGSVWHAEAESTGIRPGEGGNFWKLAVKRGSK